MRTLIALYCGFCMLLYSTPCLADLIELKDGTVVKGEIQKEEGTKIYVKTDSGIKQLDISGIKKIDTGSAVPTGSEGSLPAGVAKDTFDKFESGKLSIKQVEVYKQSVERIGTRYYRGYYRYPERIYAVKLQPRQEWEVLKGGAGITDLEFMKLVDAERAAGLEKDINNKIKEDRDASDCYTLTGITGAASMLVSAVPFQENADLVTGSKYYSYNQLNSILLVGGALLFVLGIFGVKSSSDEAASLEMMKTDPLLHFNDLQYTQGKINEYNNKLKLQLNIHF